MAYSVQQIKFEIYSYIKEFGANFSEWYIGIAADPKATLGSVHGVDPEKDIWLYKQAVSFAACRTVVGYFIDTLKLEGSLPASGDADMDCVYLYKKSLTTLP